MTGSLHHAPAGALDEDPYRRAVVTLDNGSDVGYRDVRRFGTWLLLEPGELEPYLAVKVGPEPLERRFTTRFLRRATEEAQGAREGGAPRPANGGGAREHLRRRGAVVRSASIRTARQASSTKSEIRAVHRGVRRALERGIARQGATLRDYRTPDGGSGSMQHEFNVYGREGEPCPRCGTPIEKTRAGGRGTWYCPACQRLCRAPGNGLTQNYTWRMAGRTYKTEAVVLRSFRFGEADRVLHLYTLDRGRVGALAKGVRKTQVAVRGAARAAQPRRARAPRGAGRATDGHGRGAHPLASCGARASVPARHRDGRCRGDAPALPRAGAEPARVPRTDQIPRPPRRRRFRRRAASGARSARAVLPAEAPLAFGLPAAHDELRRVRSGDEPGGLLAAGRRRALHGVLRRRHASVPAGPTRHRSAAQPAACRCRPRVPDAPGREHPARRSPSSTPRTSTTEASACARWPPRDRPELPGHDPRARGVLGGARLRPLAAVPHRARRRHDESRRPFCAASARSPGARRTSSRRSARRTAATARTRSGSSSSGSTR